MRKALGLAIVATVLTASQSAQSGIFADIPAGASYEYSAETLYRHGVTVGCATNPLRYCPDDAVTRLQMAIFMLRGMHGPGYVPPAATHTFTDTFNDDAKWASKAIVDGVLEPCDTSRFCPTEFIPRYEMARALARARRGPVHTGKLPLVGIFADVSLSSPYAPFIEQIYADAVTTGCASNPARFCPNDLVTRATMALFMVRNFEWRTPEPASCGGSPCVRTIVASPQNLNGGSIFSEGLSPRDLWTVEVRYMGDNNSPERLGQVANQITWNVGAVTGLSTSSSNTRGYLNVFNHNAFQADGASFGSHIHSWSFPHTNGVPGGGPHSVMSYVFSDYLAPQVFTQPNGSFVFEAYLKVPEATTSELPSDAPLFWYPRGEISLEFQFWQVDGCQPPNCPMVDYVAKTFDTRPYALGLSNSFQITSYEGAGLGVVIVPMRSSTTFGHTWVDVTAPQGQTGATMRNVFGYADERLYRFAVTRAELSNAIAALNAQGGTFSSDTSKYRLRGVSVLHEVLLCAYVPPPVPTDHQQACSSRAVKMGASARAPRVMEWY